tara:strand:- start:1564 stop:1893 length:330 start_codon:yes stop_codon:yes gene_type:complete
MGIREYRGYAPRIIERPNLPLGDYILRKVPDSKIKVQVAYSNGWSEEVLSSNSLGGKSIANLIYEHSISMGVEPRVSVEDTPEDRIPQTKIISMRRTLADKLKPKEEDI